MSSDLFWCRRVRVTVGSNENPNNAITFGNNIPVDEDGYDADFRIDFSIRKTRDKTPNGGTIKIYNLSLEERGIIDKEYNRVTISAGYQGDTPIESNSGFWGFLLDGWIEKVTHERRGVDIVTEIECTESAPAQNRSRVNNTYQTGVSYRTVVEDIVRGMPNVKLGDISGIPSLSAIVSRGLVLSGSARNEIDLIARMHDARSTIDNGVLDIINNYSGKSTGYVVPLFDKESGLISVSKIEKGISFTAFINASVSPNRYVRVIDEILNSGRDSRTTLSQAEKAKKELEKEKSSSSLQESGNASGVYRVNNVVFNGTTSSSGGNFIMRVEGQSSNGFDVIRGENDVMSTSRVLKNIPLPRVKP